MNCKHTSVCLFTIVLAAALTTLGATWVSGSDAVDQYGVYGTNGVVDMNDLALLASHWLESTLGATWVSGSDAINQYGVYGTKGLASASNVPGGRYGSISWTDADGNLWLFGGAGFNAGSSGYLNDLWKFNGTNWTWISGSNAVNQYGVYGTKGVASAGNVPGARYGSISWTEAGGDLWLFGGYGFAATSSGYLNDLWKFDGTNWTWVGGSTAVNQHGVYGTKGVPASGNVPGARRGSISWTDAGGNLWLFGGWGYDASGSSYNLNDLWKFDGSNWTWVGGSNAIDQYGVYGTKGVASAANVPGARDGSISWSDASGNLWLLGGLGYAASSWGYLNDLWKFDGTNWTWVSGSNAVDQYGAYGTKGVASASNVPGSRNVSISWTDAGGNLWLLGGLGYAASSWGYLNDLWKFDGTNWTWVGGSGAVDQYGAYGTKGVASASNVPGTRNRSISWTDAGGNRWLFGGLGYAASGSDGRLNDLWKVYDKAASDADLDHNGLVNMNDFALLALHWME